VDLITPMEWIIKAVQKFMRKHFNWFTNINFILAILVITGSTLPTIMPDADTDFFTATFTWTNIVFSVYNILFSIYLYYHSRFWFIKISRVLFFMLAVFCLYLNIQIIIHGVGYHETLLASMMLFLSFLVISFQIASTGNTGIHPSLLFVFSFAALILFGSLLLILPEATTKPITFLQALFTSTSAVTVTGLAVLDTGKDFTYFGQIVILLLIQLGGIGILTITNIFSLVFKASSSFRNRLMLGEMIKEMDDNKTFTTLFRIIAITLLVEAIGAVMIYFSIKDTPQVTNQPVFFAVFHAVSGFCNAGFSTLSSSLYDVSVKFNYFMQLVICWLIITGGLGYTVMINHFRLLWQWIRKLLDLSIYRGDKAFALIKNSVNSWIVFWMTLLLLVAGTGLFMAAEYDGVLREHSLFGKMVVSFFNATTPRTAGFNNVDMGMLGIPSVMLIMALMWIGASPGSTGGGIKTTTFYLAIHNLYNQIMGKEQLVIKNKNIPQLAINQINAVILLSIFAISFGTFLLSFQNPDKLFRDMLFEAISAYSTVGLSLNLTPALTEVSHSILIALMFLGRVSFLTFLVGLFNQFLSQDDHGRPYYPNENVYVN